MNRYIFLFLIAAFSLLLHAKCVAQKNIVYGAGITYTVGIPTFVPPGNSSRVAIDTVTSKWYEYAQAGGWRWSGDRVQDISGCSAPAYTPGKAQSRLVLNACTEAQNGHGPELYKYTGSEWLCLNCGGNYTAGDGIDITGTEITNTAPDQVVSIAGAGINAITGTYPNFTVTGTEVDGSVTNELQTLSSGTNTVTLSNSGGTVTVDTDPTNDITTITAGTGIGVSGTGNSRTVTNTAPDQTVTISGATGSYPNFTIPTPAVTLNDLTDVTISSPTNTQVLQYNSATTQWVNATLSAITGSGQANRLAFFTGSGSISSESSFTVDSVNNRLTLGPATPHGRLNIAGTGSTSSTISLSLESDGSPYLSAYDNGSIFIRKSQTIGTTGYFGVKVATPLGNNTGPNWQEVAAFTGGVTLVGSQPFYGARGMSLYVNNQNSSIPNQITGAYFIVQNETGGARATQMRGFEAYMINNATGGTIEEVSGLSVGFLTNPSGSTVTNTHGVLIGDMTPAGGAQTNVYSVRCTDINAVLLNTGSGQFGSGTVDASAKINAISTTQGILFPRMTATQRDAIASPPDGLVVYNTTAAKLQVRAASAWADLH